MAEALQVLQEVFGYPEFRPHQAEVVGALASGRDALAVMPTSAGKSICYQVPAIMAPSGVAVVVSPLISLMADQVAALVDAGVSAAYLNSTLSGPEKDEVFRAIGNGLTLLYVAPERLGDPRLRSALNARGVSLVAVDEAHCISQWGCDFRPDYLRIRDFIDSLDVRPPVAALTATATGDVRADIEASLGLRDPLRVVASFDRPNLAFSVVPCSSEAKRTRWVVDYVRGRASQSGIVYCATRKQTDAVWEALRAAGVRAGRYHGGMDDAERAREQDDFVHDRTCVVVATNAFGMGIDKSDVSYVVHTALPQSLEAYYQEAGRAGRDGTAAECTLLYRDADLGTARFLIEHSSEGSGAEPGDPAEEARLLSAYGRLEAMRQYATGERCLRQQILAYFGEESEPCGDGVEPCGNCLARRDVELENRQLDALKLVSCVARLQSMRSLQGRARVIDIVRGAKTADVRSRGFDALSTYGILSRLSKDEVAHLIDVLVEEGILAQRASRLPVLYVTDKGARFMQGPWPVEMLPGRRGAGASGGGAGAGGAGGAGTGSGRRRRGAFGSGLGEGDQGLFERLRSVRAELAGDKPAYIVASNATLEDLAARRPHTMEELLEVRGIGGAKAERYGEALLEAVASWELENGR